MIEKLNRLARLMAPLKWPTVILALAFVVSIVAILWFSSTGGDDVLLIPCIVGFFATLSAYSLITNFQNVPRRVEKTDSFWTRVKIRYYRSIFWLLGIVFVATTLIFLSMAMQLLGIWIKEH